MILKQTADTSEEVGFQICPIVCLLYCFSSFFVLLRILVYRSPLPSHTGVTPYNVQTSINNMSQYQCNATQYHKLSLLKS